MDQYYFVSQCWNQSKLLKYQNQIHSRIAKVEARVLQVEVEQELKVVLVARVNLVDNRDTEVGEDTEVDQVEVVIFLLFFPFSPLLYHSRYLIYYSQCLLQMVIEVLMVEEDMEDIMEVLMVEGEGQDVAFQSLGIQFQGI